LFFEYIYFIFDNKYIIMPNKLFRNKLNIQILIYANVIK